MSNARPEARYPTGILLAVLAAASAYALYRAMVLEIDYYDAYSYMKYARQLVAPAGTMIETHRPPLLPLLQVPAVALAAQGAPANPWLLRLPHLTNALLSLFTLGAVFLAFRRAIGATGGLLGAVLFAATRWFVHYCAFVMVDVLVAGLSAATIWLFLAAREARGWRWLGWSLACGAALGAAAVTKPPAALLAPTLVLAELALVVRWRRSWGGPLLRFDWRRWVGLVLVGAAAAGVAAFIYWAAFRLLSPAPAWPRVVAAVRDGTVFLRGFPGESWTDFVKMIPVMLSVPVTALAAGGVILALARPRPQDVPFLAWLAVVPTGIILIVHHTEARYLLPAVPAFVYFAARAGEALRGWLLERTSARARQLGGVALLVALGGCLGTAVTQAWADRDPAFTTDRERKTTALMLAARRGTGRLLFGGRIHSLFPREPGPLPSDDFWNVYHFTALTAEYLAGRDVGTFTRASFTPEQGRGELVSLLDGDAVVMLDGTFHTTLQLPRGKLPNPIAVWSIRRHDLRRQGDALASSDGAVHGHVQKKNGVTTFVPDTTVGPFWIYAADKGPPRFVADAPVEKGRPIPLGGDVTNVILLRIDRQLVQ